MLGSISDKVAEAYWPVDETWERVELSLNVMSLYSLIPEHHWSLSKPQWTCSGEHERRPGFDMPEGDWTELAKKVATEDLHMPCKLDKVNGNLFTFSPTSRRPCCHEPDGHDSNRFTLVFTERGFILYRCLQDVCITKGASVVGSWDAVSLNKYTVQKDRGVLGSRLFLRNLAGEGPGARSGRAQVLRRVGNGMAGTSRGCTRTQAHFQRKAI